MKVILTPVGFEFRELRAVFVDVAAVGSLLAVLTEDGIYLVHIDRLSLDTDSGTREIIAKLAQRGLRASDIARQLGVSQRTAERYHPAPYASQDRKTNQERSDHAGRHAQPRQAPDESALRGEVGEDRADLGEDPKGKSRDRRGLGAARRRRTRSLAPAG